MENFNFCAASESRNINLNKGDKVSGIWNGPSCFISAIEIITSALTLYCLMSNKRSRTLNQTFSIELQVCLIMRELLVDTMH